MFSRLWGAFARVVDGISAIGNSLFALADTLRQANAVIRERGGVYFTPAEHVNFVDRVQTFLGKVNGRLSRLVSGLKQHRRKSRAVQAAVQSLRQIRLDS